MIESPVWLFPLLFLSILMLSCSTTRHTAFPAYGYSFTNKPTIIVGVHDNSIITTRDTKLLMETLGDCDAHLVDISTLNPSEYRSFFDLDIADSLKLETVGKETKADYLLLGTFKKIKSSGGLLSHSNLNQYDLAYNTEDFEPESVFELILYDLAKKRIELQLTTTTQPWTLGFENEQSPTEHWVHPGSPFMLSTNFKKARKKFKKLCQC